VRYQGESHNGHTVSPRSAISTCMAVIGSSRSRYWSSWSWEMLGQRARAIARSCYGSRRAGARAFLGRCDIGRWLQTSLLLVLLVAYTRNGLRTAREIFKSDQKLCSPWWLQRRCKRARGNNVLPGDGYGDCAWCSKSSIGQKVKSKVELNVDYQGCGIVTVAATSICGCVEAHASKHT
jgi:hypothetical protein